MKEDPRIGPGQCGVTQTTFGTEWKCIKEVHGKIYERHTKGRRGKVIYSSGATTDSHYFVPRWVKEDEEEAV